MGEKKVNAVLKIERCSWKGVEVWKSPKNGQTYYTAVISIGVNDLRIGCGEYDLEHIQQNSNISLEASVMPDRFGKLEFNGFPPKIEQLAG